MKLVSEKEFRTETLGISATSFWRLKKSGDLPTPIVIGRRNYYSPDSITEWLASKKSGKDCRSNG
jgi:predicted DNA-binding transcriptional regulator AlpA